MLYQRRITSAGHAFPTDSTWQREFEEGFGYIETPDQLTAIEAVKADMESEKPMDRLLCGDVGFGKTEVALRAAFKAVQDGKQVAVLVPTTLLAQQHGQTFAQRLAGYPVRVALTLAVLGSRRARDLIWVGLAGLGVLLLGLQPGDLTWAGVGFALLAGGCWAAYILLAAQAGRRWQGIDGLAIASVVATLLLTPLTLGRYADQLADTRILVIGALVGLLSSVIPYTCELVALRTMRPAVFSILMSLEPAAAALAGLIVLEELLGPVQLAAMACVVVASVGATRSGATISDPVPD